MIADRKAAEAAEEARIKQAAIDAMGIDALGPRPTDEPGLYHQLVDATETRVPVLDEFRGTERDGTSTGKDSSFHAYAPPFAQLVESPTQLAGAPMQATRYTCPLPCTLQATRCTLHATRYTLHAARCTLHATRYTPQATRHIATGYKVIQPQDANCINCKGIR